MPTVKGGDKLGRALSDMAEMFGRAEGVKVGFLEKAKYPDGTSVAMVAAINEFGKPPKQPPRPFFREMIKEKSPGWPKGIADAITATKGDTARAFEIVGAAVKGQLQQKITTYAGPALAPSTIKRKGFDKQLIDTSVMLNSVDYEVIK